MRKTLEEKLNLLFSLMLILFLYYYSFRYIFQYNDNIISSWVYSDTPAGFKWAKYILYLILLVLIFIGNRGFRIEKENRIIKIPVLILIFQSGLYAILVKNQPILTFALLLCPILLFPGRRNEPKSETVEKILDIFWYYTTIYEIIQVVLYYTTGRVPSMAFPHFGTLMAIRYGGAFDDPNGYGIVMTFYIFYFLMKQPGPKNIIRLLLALVQLFFTWSGTGYLAFAATVIVFFLVRIKDKAVLKRYGITAAIILVPALLAAVIKPGIYSDFINYFVSGKSGSMPGHLADWNVSKYDLGTWLGVHPTTTGYAEVGYIRMLSIGGLPSILLFLTASIAGIARYCRKLGQAEEAIRPLYYGAMAYLICFLAAMFNLPKIVNFDCMGIFSVFIILAMTKELPKELPS